MESSSSNDRYWNLRPFENKTAARKWEFLQARGFYVESTNEYGIVFKEHRGPAKGFIDWWGKVTWEE